MKKKYKSPEIQVLLLTEDVVRTSTELPEDPIDENWLLTSSW